jgi:uncharacterized protein YbjT (DUF2867 family)
MICPQINITRLHRQAEKIIEDPGIPFTFLRPNFFYAELCQLSSW